jgi:SOS-response transcriptional repressor LexA
VIFATQRPQSVSKSVFDLCDTFYISKQKAPRTIDYILDILDLKGSKDMGAKIRRLQHRQFLKYDDEIKIYTVPEYKYANKQ